MKKNEYEVMYHCYSEQDSSACCAFGICMNSVTEEDLYDSFIYNSDIFEEAFWENSREFEPGVEKAATLVQTGVIPTIQESLKAVFGHFKIIYEIDGTMKETNWNVDHIMYVMIEKLV